LEVGQALVHFMEMAGMAGLQPLAIALVAAAVLRVMVAQQTLDPVAAAAVLVFLAER
jgi:hypothetical protein